MAKRARLTTEEVIEDWDDIDLTDSEEWEGLDGVQEPVTLGSDDEFSDLEEDLEEEEEEYCERVEEEAGQHQEAENRDGVELEENSDACIREEMEESTDGMETNNAERVDVNTTVPTLKPRDGTTWSAPGATPPVQQFSSHVGPSTTIPECPLNAFLLTFTPDLIALIVRESNDYAKEVMGEEKYATWEPITELELRAYLGFSIIMAIAHVPAIDDYWKRDPVLRYAPVSDRISRDRFRDISRYLHFTNNSTLVPRGSLGHDRLGKIRPILTYLCQRFSSLYDPPRELSVDEAMIKFQGRSSLKQYMPKKPIKRGIKVWVLADSANGYFSRLEVYSGKQTERVEKGLGARVVRSLSADFQGKFHHVVFDNYFTDYNLLEDMLEVGLYGCGTARKDRRGFPEELKNIKLKNR